LIEKNSRLPANTVKAVKRKKSRLPEEKKSRLTAKKSRLTAKKSHLPAKKKPSTCKKAVYLQKSHLPAKKAVNDLNENVVTMWDSN
jgi:hypothetical protein